MSLATQYATLRQLTLSIPYQRLNCINSTLPTLQSLSRLRQGNDHHLSLDLQKFLVCLEHIQDVVRRISTSLNVVFDDITYTKKAATTRLCRPRTPAWRRRSTSPKARALRHSYVSLWVCLLAEAGEWFSWFMVVENLRDVAYISSHPSGSASRESRH